MKFQKGHKINVGRPSGMKGKHQSEEAKRKIGEASKGRKPSEETKQKISLAHKKLVNHTKGWHWTTESRINFSQSKKGENGNNWKGGIASENKLIRKGIEYRLWREAVFSRDAWTCQICNKVGDKLHPHHIKNFSEFPELRFAIDNGITLCEECHKNFHKKYGWTDNSKEQLENYLELWEEWLKKNA